MNIYQCRMKTGHLSVIAVLHMIRFVNSACPAGCSCGSQGTMTCGGLDEIPRFQSPMPGIVKLNLQRNKIWRIPSNVLKQLTNLKELDLMLNPIERFEADCFNGVNGTLQTLRMDYLSSDSDIKARREKTLQNAFDYSWPNLKVLSLKNNYLASKLHDGLFRNMHSLEILTLMGNSARGINRTDFEGLTNVRYLDLSLNFIRYIESGSFSYMKKLKTLNLNDQNIYYPYSLNFSTGAILGIELSVTSLHLKSNRVYTDELWKSIAKMTNLETLDLCCMTPKLNKIPDLIFQNHTKLSDLMLQENLLSYLTQASLYGLANTANVIDLRSNGIRIIEECVFRGFARLGQLSLESNPLHCDCQWLWIYDVFDSGKLNPLTVKATCATPDSLRKEKLGVYLPRTKLVCTHSYLPQNCTYSIPSPPPEITWPSKSTMKVLETTSKPNQNVTKYPPLITYSTTRNVTITTTKSISTLSCRYMEMTILNKTGTSVVFSWKIQANLSSISSFVLKYMSRDGIISYHFEKFQRSATVRNLSPGVYVFCLHISVLNVGLIEAICESVSPNGNVIVDDKFGFNGPQNDVKFRVSSNKEVVTVGDEFVAHCLIPNISPESFVRQHDVAWFHNSRQISFFSDILQDTRATHYTTSPYSSWILTTDPVGKNMEIVLKIKKVDRYSSGTYTCLVKEKNKMGQRQSVQLVVTETSKVGGLSNRGTKPASSIQTVCLLIPVIICASGTLLRIFDFKNI